MNTIRLTNSRHLLACFVKYGIQFGKPMKELLESILCDEHTNDIIDIIVSKKFLCNTYATNPNLIPFRLRAIKRSYDKSKVYPYSSRLVLSAYQDSSNHNRIIVHRGLQKVSNTFQSKAINSIRRTGRWHALKGSIPLTYLTRPRQFSVILEREFPGTGFAIIAKKKSITWQQAHLTI